MTKLPDKEGLGGERVGLDIHIGVGDVVHETGLADIREAGDHEGAFIGIHAGETGHVLANFFQVDEGRLELLGHGGHAAETSLLKHFAAVERVGIFHESKVILGNVVDEGTCRVDVAECELVMVLVVKDVDKGGVERVDIVGFWEILKTFR